MTGRFVRFASAIIMLVLGVVVAGCASLNREATSSPVASASPTAIAMMAIQTPTPAPIDPNAPTPVAAQTVATPTPLPAPPGKYIVQPGDTLYGIAVRHRVTVQALMQVNSITDPATIQVGQILDIPERSTP